MNEIRSLVADTGVQTLVGVVVKVVGRAGLRISQVGKNRLFPAFELFGFEA
jgi:hypothetical protein